MDTPVVFIDKLKLTNNIKDMADFAKQHRLALRPHVKAHKSADIARLQAGEGAQGFAVAKLSEAEGMFKAGFSDLTIAFPLIGSTKMRRVVSLMQAGCRLTLMVDSVEGAEGLSALAFPGGVDILVKVDSGLHRCGLEPGPSLYRLIEDVCRLRGLNFRGIMTHAGHAYASTDLAEVKKIGFLEGKIMADTALELERRGIKAAVVSVGSTPTAKFAGLVPGITEIRPGNYVFYDATQVMLGVATPQQCSLTVLATVVSRPSASKAIIDAGAKVLALDRGAHGSSSIKGHGILTDNRWSLTRLSEEHGVLEGEELPLVGAIIPIIPNHACPVVNLSDWLSLGEDCRWPVTLRGCTR